MNIGMKLLLLLVQSYYDKTIKDAHEISRTLSWFMISSSILIIHSLYRQPYRGISFSMQLYSPERSLAADFSIKSGYDSISQTHQIPSNFGKGISLHVSYCRTSCLQDTFFTFPPTMHPVADPPFPSIPFLVAFAVPLNREADEHQPANPTVPIPVWWIPLQHRFAPFAVHIFVSLPSSPSSLPRSFQRSPLGEFPLRYQEP